MKFYLCKCEPSDKRYGMVTRHGSPFSHPLTYGEEVASIMAQHNAEAVTYELDETRGGLDLPDLVGTNLNFLIVRKRCAEEILATHKLGPHEVVSAVLVNSKQRVHSHDYLVLNPHGRVDCIDVPRSDVRVTGDKISVKLFGKFWLKASDVPPDRDIFRVKGLAIGYIFSERLVKFVRQQRYTNFKFEDVQLS